METASGKHADYVIRRLCKDVTDFDFFQAVRMMELTHSDKPRVGTSLRVADDLLRFGQSATLEFEPTTLSAFVTGRKSTPTLFVYFLGLLGPNGSMPLFLTEFARNRERNYNDSTQNRFLDVFHNRIIALFYRAWALNSQVVSYDRPDDDWIGLAVSCVGGYGDAALNGRDSVPVAAKRFFSGHLSYQSTSAEGLESILSAFFEIDVKVTSFTHSWRMIPREYRCRLESRDDKCKWLTSTGTHPAEDANNELGATSLIGSSYPDVSQRFTITLGPLGFEDFERMLPGTKSFSRLMDWVRNYLTDPLAWDIRFTLKADEVPDTRLGGYGRLGYSTWLKSKPFQKDTSYPRLDSEIVYLNRSNQCSKRLGNSK